MTRDSSCLEKFLKSKKSLILVNWKYTTSIPKERFLMNNHIMEQLSMPIEVQANYPTSLEQLSSLK